MTTSVIVCAVFGLGLIVGSFLNVVALRYNTGRLKDALFGGGRSVCFSCGKKLKWYELIPLASFLVQGGRCRGCHSKISWQYPLVELFTGVVFVLVFLHETVPALAILGWIIFSILIVISVYDVKHKIIPDGLAYAFASLGLIYAILAISPSVSPLSLSSLYVIDPWNLAAGPLLFLPFFALWYLSKGAWIGLGDGKLSLGIGWFLGLTGGISAVVMAFWLGAIVSIFLLVIERVFRTSFMRLNMKSEIPFAPFLIFCTLLVYLTGLVPTDIILWVQNLF